MDIPVEFAFIVTQSFKFCNIITRNRLRLLIRRACIRYIYKDFFFKIYFIRVQNIYKEQCRKPKYCQVHISYTKCLYTRSCTYNNITTKSKVNGSWQPRVARGSVLRALCGRYINILCNQFCSDFLETFRENSKNIFNYRRP